MVAWWVVVTVVAACLYTFLPEMDRGRTFLEELRYAAILATVIGVAIVALNVIMDGWDRARTRRRGPSGDGQEQETQ